MPRTTPPEKRRAILAAYKADVPIGEIAKRHGVCRATVTNIRAETGVEIRPNRRTITRQEAEKFARLTKSMKQQDAADALGRDQASLAKACRRFDVETHRRKKQKPRGRPPGRETKDWFSLPPWERMASFIAGYNGGL